MGNSSHSPSSHTNDIFFKIARALGEFKQEQKDRGGTRLTLSALKSLFQQLCK